MTILATRAVQGRDLGCQIHVSLGAAPGCGALHLTLDHQIEASECVGGTDVLSEAAHGCVDGLHPAEICQVCGIVRGTVEAVRDTPDDADPEADSPRWPGTTSLNLPDDVVVWERFRGRVDVSEQDVRQALATQVPWVHLVKFHVMHRLG